MAKNNRTMAARARSLVIAVSAIAIAAAGGGSVPAAVTTQGLEAVWNLRVGGSTTVGLNAPLTKVLGVDTLPSGAVYGGTFLIITAPCTMMDWDLSTISAAGYVETTGTGTITFTNCKFKFHPTTTSPYLLRNGDAGNVTTTCTNCLFDGGKLSRSQPSGAILQVSGTLNLNYCDITGQPADGVKQNNGALVVRYCRIQNVGWYSLSDPDGMHIGGGSADVQYCLFDVRDGSGLGAGYTGQPLNNFFRAESFAATITSIIFKNNICVGIKAFTAAGGYTSLDVKDVNPNAITSVLYENNVIEKGKSVYTYQDGTTRYPLLTASEWFDNRDYDTNAVIPHGAG